MPRSEKNRTKISKLKNGRKQSASSQRWLRRQLNDPYVEQARQQGYRSRAAFKLLQLNERYKIFKPHQKVIDLGAAPGGWSQVALACVNPGGSVIAVDLEPLDPLPDLITLELDFLSSQAPALICEALRGKADVVLSDMAPSASGNRSLDHLRIMALAEAALLFAEEVLASGGCFVVKIWHGAEEKKFMEKMRLSFARILYYKPPASRSDSAEIYIIGINRKHVT